jgi:hypothetical protein
MGDIQEEVTEEVSEVAEEEHQPRVHWWYEKRSFINGGAREEEPGPAVTPWYCETGYMSTRSLLASYSLFSILACCCMFSMLSFMSFGSIVSPRPLACSLSLSRISHHISYRYPSARVLQKGSSWSVFSIFSSFSKFSIGCYNEEFKICI